VINASYPSGPGPKVILAVGNEVMEDLLRMIMVSMTLILVSLLIAAIITYTTYKGRKKALEAER
jgi:cell division protein FtsL